MSKTALQLIKQKNIAQKVDCVTAHITAPLTHSPLNRP